MKKRELKKNRLDIEYKYESQKAILYLSFCTVSIIGFLGYMISRGLIAIGIPVAVALFFISFVFYKQTKKKMDTILSKIERL
ncbi:MAG: hypothetical protein V1659_00295 [Candidatus Woesearchaeota archaeon]